MHIGLQGITIEEQKLPPSNFVFLIDVSGSMGHQLKLPLLQSTMKLLVNELRPEDRVAIVVYAGAAGIVLESTPGSHKDEITSAINNLQAGGSTAGSAGIKLAYEMARKNFLENGNNRVILATDGDFNVGVTDRNELVEIIREKASCGIFLTVLGFGDGYFHDTRMETIANKGNGTYYFIDRLEEGRKALVTEMGGLYTIAKDVKIQVEFNPLNVEAYRLIGYENRLLAAEDFNDDTKDAGEIGSGHTVTALYEVVPPPMKLKKPPKIDPLKYQDALINTKAEFKDELLTLKVRYKEPREDRSKLMVHPLVDKDKYLEDTSENFRFSAAVAEFGMLLSNSPYIAKGNTEQLLRLAKSAVSDDEHGYRTEFIKLVETYMKIKERQ